MDFSTWARSTGIYAKGNASPSLFDRVEKIALIGKNYFACQNILANCFHRRGGHGGVTN